MTDVNKLLMRLTGTDRFGDGQYGPPEAKTFRYKTTSKSLTEVGSDAKDYQVITSNNDGFELWLGWANEWKYHMDRREVWALFKWLAIEWYLKSRWLGLRRPIYYWALNRHVQSFRKGVKR